MGNEVDFQVYAFAVSDPENPDWLYGDEAEQYPKPQAHFTLSDFGRIKHPLKQRIKQQGGTTNSGSVTTFMGEEVQPEVGQILYHFLPFADRQLLRRLVAEKINLPPEEVWLPAPSGDCDETEISYDVLLAALQEVASRVRV